MDFEQWIRAQLEPGTPPPAVSAAARRAHAFGLGRRGRFLQGLMAGAALTFLFLGASSSGSVPSLKIRLLPVQPQALPVAALAGAPTVPDPVVAPAPAAVLVAGQKTIRRAPTATGPTEAAGASPAIDGRRDGGLPDPVIAPGGGGSGPSDDPRSRDGGQSPGGPPEPTPPPDDHLSDSGKPPGG